jgi:hypothetical protein
MAHIVKVGVLICLSIAILFPLGMAMQTALDTYCDYLQHNGIATFGITNLFLTVFSHRPNVSFTQVFLWFGWLMSFHALYYQIQYSEDHGKALQYSVFAINVWWLIIGLFVASCLFLCAMPLNVLMVDITPRHPLTTVINVISILLPVIVVVCLLLLHRRSRSKSNIKAQ